MLNLGRWEGIESCISCQQEKRNEKVWNLHSIMANLNLGQDVANKREKIGIACHNVKM